jgi:hypothetical protein
VLDRLTVEFANSFRDSVIFCRDGAGVPIGYPMRTVACRESVLVYTTYRKSAKVAHMERDPRVCVLVSETPPAGERAVRWVSIAGTVRIVSPTEDEIRESFAGGRRGPSIEEGVSEEGESRVPAGIGTLVQERLRGGKRVLLLVEDLHSTGLRSGIAT